MRRDGIGRVAPGAIAGLVAAILLLSGALLGAGAELVVSDVEKRSPADRAGFVAGDRLSKWERGERGGRFDSPREFDRVATEELPRGAVEVTVARGGGSRRIVAAVGFHGMKIRPRLRGDADSQLAAAVAARDVAALEALATPLLPEDRDAATWLLVERALRSGRDEAPAAWDDALAAARPDPPLRRWVRAQQAQALLAADPAAARAILEERLAEVAGEAPGSLSEAQLLRNLGTALYYQGDLEASLAAQSRALEIRQRLAPGSLDLAGSLTAMFAVAIRKGDLEAAADWNRQALEIRSKLAPGSSLEAGSLSNAGVIAHDLGDLEAAEAFYRRALAVTEEVAPNAPEIGSFCTNLGILSYARGDLDGAAAWHARALENAQRTGKGPLELAVVYETLGVVAFERRDLVTAESWHRKVLAIREQYAPGSLGIAATLNNLALIALARGELDLAFEWEVGALEINEAHSPGSLEVALNLHNLAAIALESHQLELAEEWELEALAIRLRRAPGNPEVAKTWASLANVEERRGRFEPAAMLYEESLAALARVAPSGLDAATFLSNLGSALTRAGEAEAALAPAERGVEIRRRLAPGSSLEAESLWVLASALRGAGRPFDAMERLSEAREALERQQSMLGGAPETLSVFRTKFLPLYRMLVDLLVEAGCVGDAAEVFEAARARALLALLAERSLVSAEVPRELERERALASAEAERVIAAVGTATDDDEVRRLIDALRGVRERQIEIRRRVMEASPRLAALRYPEPLSAGEMERLLPEGTLALAWILDAPKSTLLAIGRDGITAHRLDADADAIRSDVETLRRAIERKSVRPEVRERLATELSRKLFGDAARRIAGAGRLVLFPDGPLWMLPFAVLPDPARPGRLLLEDHPLVLAPSATVLAQLMKERRPRGTSLVAFGDPVYPEAGVSSERGTMPLRALPGTRREVESIARLYGSKAVTHLGAEANEEAVRAMAGGDRRPPAVIHFAAHAVVDESRPLASAVVLSRKGDGDDPSRDGRLEAGELFEGLRFDCDLVVLSACETALGREEAGEGILGLTRGFQYAGARSVLASLWTVSDESTGLLMKRFHAGFDAGLGRDEALRQAQLALLRGATDVGRDGAAGSPDASHPFHWAGFELFGDWE